MPTSALLYFKKNGYIYKAWRIGNAYDEQLLALFFLKCHGISTDALFDALQTHLGLSWKQVYDVVNPYGDQRGASFETVWTFDLDRGLVTFRKRTKHGTLPLSVLLHRRVTIDDFDPLRETTPLESNVANVFPPPYWEPPVALCSRHGALVARLFEDFAHQWRHILRAHYNDQTFRRLVRAVVRFLTLDFRVIEITEPRHVRGRQPYVWPDALPAWEACEGDIIKVGSAWIAFGQSLSDCLSSVRKHAKELPQLTLGSNSDRCSTYMILTIRYAVLCHARGEDLRWTEPAPFWDGTGPPCQRALEILLSTSPPAPINTPIHSLPLELQDRILKFTCRGPVEAARLGCALGLGSPFLWKDGNLTLEREEVPRNRSESSPVESEIHFGLHHSGLSYKA